MQWYQKYWAQLSHLHNVGDEGREHTAPFQFKFPKILKQLATFISVLSKAQCRSMTFYMKEPSSIKCSSFSVLFYLYFLLILSSRPLNLKTGPCFLTGFLTQYDPLHSKQFMWSQVSKWTPLENSMTPQQKEINRRHNALQEAKNTTPLHGAQHETIAQEIG